MQDKTRRSRILSARSSTMAATRRASSSVKSFWSRAAELGIPRVKPEIVCVLAHDSDAFTQGLFYAHPYLIESTGGQETSSLRYLNPETGEVLKKVVVPGFFCEGVAVLDHMIVQLTWKSERAFIYSFPDMNRIGALKYEGEGWGLATNGRSFLMTDGTGRIAYRDKNFQVTRQIVAKRNRFPMNRLNDITWRNGMIFANVFYNKNVYQIDDKTGNVVKIVDCSALLEIAKPTRHWQVMNGIAYHDRTDTFFVTGKHWEHLFRIRIYD